MTMFSQNATINNLREKKQKLEDKLNAVKELVEKGPQPEGDTVEDYQRAVDDWLGKLMNILKVEG